MPGKQARSREPLPPFVEPSLYFEDLTTHDALLRVVHHLLGRGAAVVSGVLGEPGDADASASLKSSSADRVTVADIDELLSAQATKGRAIAEVTLASAGQGCSGRDVIVSALSIPEAAAGADRHPVSIACDGRAFEPYAASSQRARAARDVLAFFADLATLQPSYGAIMFEYPLPSPYQVAERPDGFEFADCYLSNRYLSSAITRHAPTLRDGGQWRDVADGAIILTSGIFAEQPDVDVLPALAAQSIVRMSAP